MRGSLTIQERSLVIASLFVSGFLFWGVVGVSAATISSAGDGKWSEITTWNSTTKTGKITFADDSLEVLGVDTLFMTELSVGSIVKATVSRGSVFMTVATIIDDKHLTVTALPSFDSGAAKTFSASILPRPNDEVIISSGDQVVVDLDTSVASLSFPTNNTGSSSLTLDPGRTLTVATTVTIPRASSPAFNILNVANGHLITGSIHFGNGGTPSAKRHQLWIGDGLATVTNVTQMGSSGSALINFNGVGKLQVAGEFLNSSTATLVPGLGTIEYNGESVQTVSVFNYHNLILSGLLIKTMLAETVIAGELSIAPTGTAKAKLVIGQQIQSGTLILGGVMRKAGTWGASEAVTTYHEDSFFAPGDGVLLVLNGGSTKAEVTSWPTVSAISYGQSLGEASLAGGVATVPGTFAWSQAADRPNEIGLISRELVFRPTDTGAYDLVYGSVQLEVLPKELNPSVSAQDKIYDGVTVAEADCNVTGLTGDELVCEVASANFDNPNVGNNKLVTVNGLHLTGAAADKYKLVDSAVTTEASINKRPISIIADSKSKIVGDSDPELTYVLSAGSLAHGDLWSGVLVRASGEDPGVYPIGLGDLRVNDNYTLQFTAANLVISEQAVVEVRADSQSIVYGQLPSDFTFSYLGLVSGDDASVIDVPPVCTISGDHSAVGVYPIICSGANDDSYDFSYQSGTLTVTKASAALELYDLQQSYTASSKSVTVTTNPSGLSIEILYKGSDQEPSAAGTYEVTVSIVDQNYTGSTSGVLKIDKAELRVTDLSVLDKIYDGTTLASLDLDQAKLVGVMGDDSLELSSSEALANFENRNVGNDKLVNVTGLKLLGLESDNYLLMVPELRADISQRQLTVQAVTDTKNYDGNVSSDKKPIITSGSLAAGDSINLSQSFDLALVGTAKVLKPSAVVDDGNGALNYLVSFVNDETGVIKEVVVSAPPASGGSASVPESPKPAYSAGIIIDGYCRDLFYGEWSECQMQKQTRVILTRVPSNCELTPSQQETLIRGCGQSLISEAKQEVLGAKIYADGTFLKASGVKIYWIIKGSKYHVKNLAELWSYKPKVIIRVTEELLARYPDRLTVR